MNENKRVATLATSETMTQTKRQGRLAELESVIESGLQTVFEVGVALIEIRDSELYIESHDSFEAYIKERWEHSRQWAYRQIDAAKTRERLSPIGDINTEFSNFNESHCRALKDVSDEDLSQVMKAAQEQAGDNPITASILKNAKREVELKRKTNDKSLVPAVSRSNADTAIENAWQLKAIDDALQDAANLASKIKSVAGTELFVGRKLSIERGIQSVLDSVRETIPHSVCPRCKGKGCGRCSNRGWVNSELAKKLG